MKELIKYDFEYFQLCILTGFMLAMSYDIFRIIRKVIRHNNYMIIIQDLFYGIGVGVYIFCLNYKNYDGLIRLFVIIGLLLGWFLYLKLFSNSVVSLFANFLGKIKKKVKSILRIVEKITINKSIRWKKYSKFRKL